MLKAKYKVLSLILSVMLVISVCSVATTSAFAQEIPTTVNSTKVVPLQTGASGDTIYCLNEAGWSTVYCYMWNPTKGTNNGAWPGQAMTNLGDNVWSYDVSGDYTMVIFNGKSSPQTSDLTYPGSGKIYNNKTNAWSTYDNSPLVVKELTSDVASPQYMGTEITLSANAATTSGTAISYKFSVTGAANQVLSDFSANSSVKWTPTVAGNYTITVDVKDDAGNTNTRSISYVVKDDSAEVNPIIKSVFPSSNSEIGYNKPVTLSITAAGGNTGTKLLFYKVTVKDPSGNQVNKAYYTLNSTYSFTPINKGVYSVEVAVQSSDNTTVTKTLTYECKDGIVNPTVPATTVAPTTVAPTTAAPTTVAPTTVAPTTVAPTTVHPTTVVPTTVAPTTVVPTTVRPTTVPSTTVAPTTVHPTTAPVTDPTAVPTTVHPTTVPVTTVLPTTVPGTTVAKDKLTINGTTFAVGDYVKYTYKLKLNENLQNIQASLDYDGTKLQLMNSSLNSADKLNALPVLSKVGGLVWNTEYPNEVHFNATDVNEGYNFSNNDTLVTLSFKIVGYGSTSLNLHIQEMNSMTKAYVSKGQVVQNFTNTTTVVKAGGILGDANSDNSLNINDATCIQKWLSALIPVTQINLQLADVNSDSVVNIKDATEIQKKLAGISVSW